MASQESQSFESQTEELFPEVLAEFKARQETAQFAKLPETEQNLPVEKKLSVLLAIHEQLQEVSKTVNPSFFIDESLAQVKVRETGLIGSAERVDSVSNVDSEEEIQNSNGIAPIYNPPAIEDLDRTAEVNTVTTDHQVQTVNQVQPTDKVQVSNPAQGLISPAITSSTLTTKIDQPTTTIAPIASLDTTTPSIGSVSSVAPVQQVAMQPVESITMVLSPVFSTNATDPIQKIASPQINPVNAISPFSSSRDVSSAMSKNQTQNSQTFMPESLDDSSSFSAEGQGIASKGTSFGYGQMATPVPIPIAKENANNPFVSHQTNHQIFISPTPLANPIVESDILQKPSMQQHNVLGTFQSERGDIPSAAHPSFNESAPDPFSPASKFVPNSGTETQFKEQSIALQSTQQMLESVTKEADFLLQSALNFVLVKIKPIQAPPPELLVAVPTTPASSKQPIFPPHDKPVIPSNSSNSSGQSSSQGGSDQPVSPTNKPSQSGSSSTPSDGGSGQSSSSGTNSSGQSDQPSSNPQNQPNDPSHSKPQNQPENPDSPVIPAGPTTPSDAVTVLGMIKADINIRLWHMGNITIDHWLLVEYDGKKYMMPFDDGKDGITVEEIQQMYNDGPSDKGNIADYVKEIVNQGVGALPFPDSFPAGTTFEIPLKPDSNSQTPAQPAQPVQPAQPQKPAQPEQPAQPQQPAQPEKPAQPAQQPVVPTKPAAPDVPADAVTVLGMYKGQTGGRMFNEDHWLVVKYEGKEYVMPLNNGTDGITPDEVQQMWENGPTDQGNIANYVKQIVGQGVGALPWSPSMANSFTSSQVELALKQDETTQATQTPQAQVQAQVMVSLARPLWVPLG